MKKTLSTKREVILKEMTIDDMDYCNDLQHICQESDGGISIYGLNKSNTAWIRKGLAGGKFKTEINGSVPDEVFKEMTLGEQEDLRNVIQECQYLGENKPSPSD